MLCVEGYIPHRLLLPFRKREVYGAAHHFFYTALGRFRGEQLR